MADNFRISVEKRLTQLDDKIVSFSKTFDDFVVNHFQSLKDEVNGIKRALYWAIGVLITTLISLVVFLLTKAWIR